MDIEYHGQYDKSTFFKAVFLTSRPTKWNAVLRIGSSILITVIFIAYIIMVAFKDSISTMETMRVSKYFLTLPFLDYFLLQPYISPYFTASKIWKNPAMQIPLTGVLSSQGVALISSSGGRDETPWRSFSRMRIGPDFISLLTGDGVISVLPRHFFKTETDWERAKQLVNFKVMEAGQKK